MDKNASSELEKGSRCHFSTPRTLFWGAKRLLWGTKTHQRGLNELTRRVFVQKMGNDSTRGRLAEGSFECHWRSSDIFGGGAVQLVKENDLEVARTGAMLGSAGAGEVVEDCGGEGRGEGIGHASVHGGHTAEGTARTGDGAHEGRAARGARHYGAVGHQVHRPRYGHGPADEAGEGRGRRAGGIYLVGGVYSAWAIGGGAAVGFGCAAARFLRSDGIVAVCRCRGDRKSVV